MTLADDGLPPAAPVFVVGRWGAEYCPVRAFVAWLRRRAWARARLCGVERGSYITARGVSGAAECAGKPLIRPRGTPE
ncbi:MAG: hypothetical protein WAO78_18245 [Roseovarius sp.]